MNKVSINSKRKMALLIAAHNEELVIGRTISSAIKAGMKPHDIYVVDDNSDDATSACVKKLIPKRNVIKVLRSGKGLALSKAASSFNLSNRYEWIHIADADGAFAPNYFRVMRGKVRVKYAAATGYVRSLPGKNVSQYRVFEYTIGMELHRRLQSMFNVIPIIPGPTSCFRSDVFQKVDFTSNSLTEDFDVTLQIHRMKLGKIQYISDAYAYTQDPKTVGDFSKQISRWNRGVMQGITKYRIGTKPQGIDIYLSMQLLQNLLLFTNNLIWVPYYAATSRNGGLEFIAATFVFDVFLTFILTMLVAIRSGRYDVMSAFPFIYVFRWLSLGIFIKAFVEVMILRKFRVTDGTWNNHRYVT